MIRNLKALGLALVAVFALGAVVASAASAQQGTLTSDGPVTLKSEELGVAGENALTAFAGPNVVECSGGTKTVYTAHTYNVTPHVPIVTPATTATLTPHYGTCVAKIGATTFPATIDLNGCDFDIHIGVTTGGVNGTYGVTFDVTCPVGKQIQVTIWTNATDHANKATPMCTIDVKEQLGLAGAHITDAGAGNLLLKGTVLNIHATKTKSPTHPLLCPEVTTATSSFHINATVKGFTGGGGATAISLSHP